MRRSSLTSSFVWHPRAGTTGRYADAATGRFVHPAAVRDALDVRLKTSGDAMAGLAEQLKAGSISLAQWQLGMVSEIKSAHLTAAALSSGGWAQMSPAAYGRVGQRLRHGAKGKLGQYEYLQGFADDIASGKQRMDGTLAARSRLYAEAARQTRAAFDERAAKDAGAVRERSIRHASDSCDSCIAEAARGWVAVGEIVPPGERQCLTRCKCSLEWGYPEAVAA